MAGHYSLKNQAEGDIFMMTCLWSRHFYGLLTKRVGAKKGTLSHQLKMKSIELRTSPRLKKSIFKKEY